jgi:RND family efflux transporter MFP subunit
MKPWKLALLILLALAVIGAAGYFGYYGFQPPVPSQSAAMATPPPTVPVSVGDVRQLVSAPGQLVGTQKMNLTLGVQGQLDEVNVRSGDPVKKGQALARLGDQDKYEAAVASTHLDLLKAQQELEDLGASAPKETADAHQALIQAEDDYTKAKNMVESLKYPRASQSRLDGAYADYQSALQNVALAQERYDKVANLTPDDPRQVDALKALTNIQKEKDRLLGVYNWLSAKPTDKDKEDAQAKLEQAKAVYDNAQRKWERVKEGPDSMTMELAQAKVADQERQYAQAQDDLAHLTLTAPFDGVITEVKAVVGDEVTAATVIMTLVNPNALEAQVTVVEEDYSLIQPGQSVQLYFDAQPDAQVNGHVTRIVPSRTDSNQPQYPVYIDIDQILARLAAGMSVDASIIITEKKSVLVLPKALVRARTDGTATVQVWANGRKESREIKIGLIGDQNVEIISGLQEGEQVIGQ